ncbi:MAG: hypothetical protein M3Y59_14000 [Myxococcota bacterium]|nr:hypothetical protein [Myxococcota bacterium]
MQLTPNAPATVALQGVSGPTEGDAALMQPSPATVRGGTLQRTVRGGTLQRIMAAGGSAEVATLAGARTASGDVPGFNEEESDEAFEAIALASDSNDATAVVEWLEAHPDPADQRAFMDMLFQYEGVPRRSSRRRSPCTVGRGRRTPRRGSGSSSGLTHDEALINAYGEKELENYQEGDGEAAGYRAYGMAQALSGLSGPALQRYMEAHPEETAPLLRRLPQPLLRRVLAL